MPRSISIYLKADDIEVLDFARNHYALLSLKRPEQVTYQDAIRYTLRFLHHAMTREQGE